jgi:alpha-tubulin suppressor-like RCC1 family protein
LHKRRVAFIACGWYHTLAVTPNGLTFAWGFNFFGELGIGSKDDEQKPQLITALQEHVVTQVSAGQFHSAAVTEDGKLYTWGNSQDDRLLIKCERLEGF